MLRVIFGIAAALALVGCGTEGTDGDGGPAYSVAGTYTLTYERVSRSDTCDTRDMDFLSGILIVTHDAGSISMDFGSGLTASGSINADSFYNVSGNFVVGSDGVAFSSMGTFTETSVTSDADVDATHETVGDYEFDSDPEPDCRIRGKITGSKSS